MNIMLKRTLLVTAAVLTALGFASPGKASVDPGQIAKAAALTALDNAAPRERTVGQAYQNYNSQYAATATTMIVGEEGKANPPPVTVTTALVGEEGGFTSMHVGEETTVVKPPIGVTSMLVGEEGGAKPPTPIKVTPAKKG